MSTAILGFIQIASYFLIIEKLILKLSKVLTISVFRYESPTEDLKEKKTLTQKDLVSFSYQVARGMEYLASRRVSYYTSSLFSCLSPILFCGRRDVIFLLSSYKKMRMYSII